MLIAPRRARTYVREREGAAGGSNGFSSRLPRPARVVAPARSWRSCILWRRGHRHLLAPASSSLCPSSLPIHTRGLVPAVAPTMTRSFRSVPDIGDGAAAEPVASKASPNELRERRTVYRESPGARSDRHRVGCSSVSVCRVPRVCALFVRYVHPVRCRFPAARGKCGSGLLCDVPSVRQNEIESRRIE